MNSEMENRLVTFVKEVVSADMIFVLGVTRNSSSTESIFCSGLYRSEAISAYFLLILVPEDPDKRVSKYQERIEQLCELVISTTCLVLDTHTFEQWVSEGHRFAQLVYSIEPIYKSERMYLGPIGLNKSENTSKEQHYREAINKYQEFMAGAELFKIRKYYKLSMFMLHQALEQVLSGVLKMGMGYYCCTHNIERLMRYAGFIIGEIHEIFPRNTETEKRLFKLLQRAYIDSRYGTDYVVNYRDLEDVFSKVVKVTKIVAAWEKARNYSSTRFD